MLAVLFDSRVLGIAALAVAGLVLAGAIFALLRALLRPLAPLARRVRAFGRAVAAPLVTRVNRVRAHVRRLRERAIDALLALDRRLGEPFARAARRVPAWLRGALLCVPRFNAWLAAVIVTLLGLALAIYFVSGWLGAALAGRTTPVAAEWLYLGAFITATVAVLVLAFWIWELARVVLLRRLRARTCAAGALFAVLVGIALLSTPEVPGEAAGGQEAAKREGGRATDVLVVVDPADPAGRQLADYVRADVASLAAPRKDALTYEVAYGLAAPSRSSWPSCRWRPTSTGRTRAGGSRCPRTPPTGSPRGCSCSRRTAGATGSRCGADGSPGSAAAWSRTARRTRRWSPTSRTPPRARA